MKAQRVTQTHIGGRASLRRDGGFDAVDVVEGVLVGVTHGRGVTHLTFETFGDTLTVTVQPDDELVVRNDNGEAYA